MQHRWDMQEHRSLVRFAIKWCLISSLVSAIIGSACALFLYLLEKATLTREAQPYLLFFLPIAGILIHLCYRIFGKSSERGTNLIMDEIHQPSVGVPIIMAPLILICTIITHLFGGSAGREGTAVQIGGSLAGSIGRWLRFDRDDIRKLLMVGIAAGFGGVFGTPLAATVFAMEVLVVGRLDYHAIFPCLVAGIVGDWSCTAWGIQHTKYSINPYAFSWLTASKIALAAIAFGLVSIIFADLTHRLSKLWKILLIPEIIRPVIGGFFIIALVYLIGTRDYLGLGVSSTDPASVTTIVSSFSNPAILWSAWLWKLIFTAITLSCGFKGGEVTPLFFIGAALGNVVGRSLGLPIDLGAGLGFVAVFAGATNTPLACTLMGIELFGSDHAVYIAIACFVAYLFSGHTGIYNAQRIATPKFAIGRDGENMSPDKTNG